MIKSKVLGVCDDCYVFCHYYQIFKKESYEKSDDLIDDYDDYDDDNFAVDGYRNNLDVITYVEFKVLNTLYTKENQHVLSSHLKIIQADDFKEQCKNQTIHTRLEKHAPPHSILQ